MRVAVHIAYCNSSASAHAENLAWVLRKLPRAVVKKYFELAYNIFRSCSMTFTEKVYPEEETHDFGLWKFYERSWSPDQQGVWTDVLGLGDETPLPADYRRVLR